MENKTIVVDLKDFYQLLIVECRYGYTRNNHLMPSGAYEKVKQYFPEMFKIDEEYAIYTLKQLCEECISQQLAWNFYDGEDDEYNNRGEAIEFISWCLQEVHKVETYWSPYNMDQYLENLKKDYEPRYNVYELKDKERILLTEKPVSVSDYFKVITDTVNSNTAIFRKETIRAIDRENPISKYDDYIYHVIEPVEKDFYVEHI